MCQIQLSALAMISIENCTSTQLNVKQFTKMFAVQDLRRQLGWVKLLNYIDRNCK